MAANAMHMRHANTTLHNTRGNASRLLGFIGRSLLLTSHHEVLKILPMWLEATTLDYSQMIAGSINGWREGVSLLGSD